LSTDPKSMCLDFKLASAVDTLADKNLSRKEKREREERQRAWDQYSSKKRKIGGENKENAKGNSTPRGPSSPPRLSPEVEPSPNLPTTPRSQVQLLEARQLYLELQNIEQQFQRQQEEQQSIYQQQLLVPPIIGAHMSSLMQMGDNNGGLPMALDPYIAYQ